MICAIPVAGPTTVRISQLVTPGQASRAAPLSLAAARQSSTGRGFVTSMAMGVARRTCSKTAAPPIEISIPASSPKKIGRTPDAMTEATMSRRVAPSAIRIPISCLRRLTENATTPWIPITARPIANTPKNNTISSSFQNASWRISNDDCSVRSRQHGGIHVVEQIPDRRSDGSASP